MLQPKWFWLIASGVGLAVAVTGVIVGWAIVPAVIKNRVKSETQLVESSDTYSKWLDLPVPIYLKVYFFNITNAGQFTPDKSWSTDPEFTEVGPYVFRERRVKYDVKEGPSDTLYYKQKITYVFDESLSPGLSEHDPITILNVPLIAVLTILDVNSKLHPLSPLVLQSLKSSGESLFMTGTVRDVMFTGHNLPNIYKVVEAAANLNGIPLPDEFKNGQFAFYRNKNDTNSEGEWRVSRGTEDSTSFSIIKSISNGKTRLEPWWYDHCAMINGTDGTMFPPFVEKTSRLYIYVPEICRSIFMDYYEETSYEDIPGYRFTLPDIMFTDPNVYTPNQCFCMPVQGGLNSSCNFNGLGRLFSCKANVPITIGKPHFLDADDQVVTMARKLGMSPQRELHDTYLDLEPHTGFPLRVHKRLQVGLELQSFKTYDMSPFNSIPHTLYPVFWADEQAELDEPLIDEIKSKLITPLNIVKVTKWSLVGVGSFVALAATTAFTYLHFKR